MNFILDALILASASVKKGFLIDIFNLTAIKGDIKRIRKGSSCCNLDNTVAPLRVTNTKLNTQVITTTVSTASGEGQGRNTGRDSYH